MLLLDLLAQTLVQADVRCCLCLALGNLFEAMSDPQFVAVSVGLGCIYKGPSCARGPAFTKTGPEAGPQKAQGTLASSSAVSTCWLPARFSHPENLWQNQEGGTSGSLWIEFLVMVIKLLDGIRRMMEEHSESFNKDWLWHQQFAPALPVGESSHPKGLGFAN